jgi:hypothetical protein
VGNILPGISNSILVSGNIVIELEITLWIEKLFTVTMRILKQADAAFLYVLVTRREVIGYGGKA